MTLGETLLWGLAANVVITTIFEASRGLGFSRLNLPLLFGAYFTAHRTRANLVGALLYLIAGWAFAIGYLWIFQILALQRWFDGLLIGLLHGLFLLLVMLPVMPYVHPRIATEYDSPSSRRRLEPPGFAGLNYGVGTPLTTLVAHSAYGLLLSLGYLHS